ncbi:penicillin-binding protein 2 [Spirochaetia bacterium]|nr:penicillin-binding protein 2 [Spirochaetia bacterium]
MDSNNDDDEKQHRRINVLQIIFILIFVVYSGKLFAMQILHGDIYRSRANDISKRTAVLPAQRGEIYDRYFNNPIVSNTDSFAVRIAPAEIPSENIEGVLKHLAEILNTTYEKIEKKLPSQYQYLFQPVEIASNVPFKTIAVIAEHFDVLPGVTWQPKPMRNYNDTGSLSHIIGYVGDITRDELTTLYNSGYQQWDVIGKAGIERQYDELLRGKEGRETRVVDVRGRLARDREIIREAPEMGKNIVLTIDRKIQTLAEKALGQRIGAVTVMRPTTGEILAMVSYPWYNPDVFNRNDVSDEYQKLINDPNKPLLNRAIQSSYPPGSTFKIVMTTGIINEDAFSIDKTIDCPGEISYGDRLWRCHIRKPGHGRLNLRNALAQSCDIYFWVVGRDYLGIERIVNYSNEFGFGKASGIDIPGEIDGFIPTPQWKDRRFHERWQSGDTMNISIGQGYALVTPLQMANMVSMVVNDGIMYKPHLVKEIRDPVTGAVEKQIMPEVIKQSEISSVVFDKVREDMRSVISEGTAQFPLNIKSVEIAGKTGTSEVGIQDHWHSWFVAFAPYLTENPEDRIVVSIIVEAVNKWEWWSPYASAIIFQGIFKDQTFEEAVAALHFQYLMPVQNRRE